MPALLPQPPSKPDVRLSAHPAFQNWSLFDLLPSLSIMDSVMTGLANNQRFPPLLFHNVRPARHMSLCIDVQIGHLTDVMDLARSHQVTEFASVSAESLGDLLAFGLIEGGGRVYKNSLFVPFERNATKAGNQRLFPVASFYHTYGGREVCALCSPDPAWPEEALAMIQSIVDTSAKPHDASEGDKNAYISSPPAG